MFLLINDSIDSEKNVLEVCRRGCLDFQSGRLMKIQNRMLSAQLLLQLRLDPEIKNTLFQTITL